LRESDEANREHLLQALRELEDPSGYIYANPADLKNRVSVNSL